MFPSQHYRTIFIVLFILIVTIVPATTQDAETTEEPTLTDVTATAIPTATLTYTPSPTLMLQPSATLTATLTPTMQAISTTIPSNISGTETAIPTLTPIIETTEEMTPISATTPDASTYTPTPTIQFAISTTATDVSSIYTPTLSAPISGTATDIPQTPVSNTLISISPTLTSISTTITPTAMPSISGTQVMVTVTPTFQATATIGGLALRYIQGVAHYQSRVTDDAGILLQVYDDDLTLVSEVETNEDGIYNIAVPLEGAFWMVFTAEGYRTERIYNTQTEALADLMLLAGDLNGDGCINFDDISLIRSQVDDSDTLFDLNDDTQTDISDLAMLAGNLNPNCMIDGEPTSTPDLSLTPTSQATEASLFTPTPMIAISTTAPSESIIIETTEEPTVVAETTEEP